MNLNRYMILINVKFLEIASSVEVKKKSDVSISVYLANLKQPIILF